MKAVLICSDQQRRDPQRAPTRQRRDSLLLSEILSTGARWPEQISHA